MQEAASEDDVQLEVSADTCHEEVDDPAEAVDEQMVPLETSIDSMQGDMERSSDAAVGEDSLPLVPNGEAHEPEKLGNCSECLASPILDSSGAPPVSHHFGPNLLRMSICFSIMLIAKLRIPFCREVAAIAPRVSLQFIYDMSRRLWRELPCLRLQQTCRCWTAPPSARWNPL